MKYLIRTSSFGKRYLAAFLMVLTVSFTVTPSVIMADEVATTSPDAPAALTTDTDSTAPSDSAQADAATSSDATSTDPAAATSTDPAETATTTDTTDHQSHDASTTDATTTPTSITTGEALNTVDVTNEVNTNIVNSTGTIDFITSTSTQSGGLDLSHVLDNLPASGTTGGGSIAEPDTSHASTTGISDSETVINSNVSTTTNDITLTASSGDNFIVNSNASSTASITTGTSTAEASLVNLVNTNIIDSNYLLFFVTKFGNLIGDILLPSFDALMNFFGSHEDADSPSADGSGSTSSIATTTFDNSNTADIENNVTLGANTGGNQATGSSTSITTGNAVTNAAVVNMANTNIIGAPAFALMVNVLGTWSGGITGLPDFITSSTTDHGVMLYFFPELRTASSSSSDPFAFSGNSLSDSTLVSNDNNAAIINNVNLLADTGGNTLDGNGTITTGNAEASTCIVNVANTNVVRASFFMGSICVLGNFFGNISFGSTTPGTPTTTPPIDTGGEGTTTPPDNGGGGGGGGGGGSALMITKTNSATGFVSPGDTITYTVVVTNNLSEPITNGHVEDALHAPDGSVITTNSWDLATIAPNEQITLHYDVTFADNAPSGVYDNHAVVTGTTIDGVPLSASADSTVTIAPFGVGGGGGSGTDGTGGGSGGAGDGGGVNGASAAAALPGGAGVGGAEGDLPGPPNTGFAPSVAF